jgi:hypothetical protein
MIRFLVAAGLAFLSVASPGSAQQVPEPSEPPAAQAPARRGTKVLPQPFPTPEEGFAALAEAVRAQDVPRMIRILGVDARPLIGSGDPAADRAVRERFAAAYAAKHEIQRPTPDRAELQVGEDGWPMPIPMLRRRGVWRFDAAAGAQELVRRRIGRNELDTIETLRAIADAQDEYARGAGRQGGFRTYARRFFSRPGARDGLYWPSAEGEPESPLGPLAATASAGGYARARQGDEPRPYHGYFFRILEGQGPAAPGGAMDYVVNGRMIGGFAVIAWPARHGASGIKTFLISHHGSVWERDLGPRTAAIAGGITRFDPGEGWVRVED